MTLEEQILEKQEKIKDFNNTLDLPSDEMPEFLKKGVRGKLQITQKELTTLQEKAKKEGSPPDKPTIEFHLEKLKQFDKQEVLTLKGADLTNYQKYRDDDKSVLAVFVASKESKRPEVTTAAKFLKKEAAKKDSNEAELKKLLLRLNSLLKVKGESQPDCKICKVSRAGKKAISTKKRGGKPTTYDECLAILNALPKAEKVEAIEELAEEAGIPIGSAKKGESDRKTGTPKPKKKPAAVGSKKYTEKIVDDTFKSWKRIVKAKVEQDPIQAYKGLCKLNEESDLVAKAGAMVLLKAAVKGMKTYAKGIVDTSFVDEFERKTQEIMHYAEEQKKKAELAEKDN